jgi:hypothetical protein
MMLRFGTNQRASVGGVTSIHLVLLLLVVVQFRSHNVVNAFQQPKKNNLSFRSTQYPSRQIMRVSTVRLSAKSNKKTATKTAAGGSGTSRQNRVQSLLDWANRSNIQLASSNIIELLNSETAGLGWYASSERAEIPSGSVVLTVPTDIALSVESPGDGPNNRAVMEMFGKGVTDLPWYVQMSLYLYTLKNTKTTTMKDYQPWLDSLPSSFDTPIHWNDDTLKELQYDYLTDSVQRQEKRWKKLHDQAIAVNSSSSGAVIKYEEFVWGCECARSRAFSGAYTGSAFNPSIYAFVLLLVTAYVGLNLGTLEQAANGAGVVVSVSILKGKFVHT